MATFKCIYIYTHTDTHTHTHTNELIVIHDVSTGAMNHAEPSATVQDTATLKLWH